MMTTTEVIELLDGAHCAELQHGIDVGAINQPPDVAIRDMVWSAREISQADAYMDCLRVAQPCMKSFRATVYLNTNEAVLPNANMVVASNTAVQLSLNRMYCKLSMSKVNASPKSRHKFSTSEVAANFNNNPPAAGAFVGAPAAEVSVTVHAAFSARPSKASWNNRCSIKF